MQRMRLHTTVTSADDDMALVIGSADEFDMPMVVSCHQTHLQEAEFVQQLIGFEEGAQLDAKSARLRLMQALAVQHPDKGGDGTS